MADPQGPSDQRKVVSFISAQPYQVRRVDLSVHRPVQLSFEFDGPHQLLIVVTDRLHGATFLRQLHQSKPKVIMDVRFAPHFNFTAIDGITIKRQIEAVGARYIRYTIPFHEFGPSLLRHDPMLIATKLSNCILRSGGSQWPLMVLLKESGVAAAFSPFLVGALSKHLGGNWMAEVIT